MWLFLGTIFRLKETVHSFRTNEFLGFFFHYTKGGGVVPQTIPCFFFVISARQF